MSRRYTLIALFLISSLLLAGCGKKRHNTMPDSSSSVAQYEKFRRSYDARGFYADDWDYDEEEAAGAGRKTRNSRDGGTPPKPNAGVTNIVLNRAHKSIGTPYHFGGTTPGGFDCSGFVQWAFKGAGIKLPRTAQEQSVSGYKIRDKSKLRAGDIVAFRRRGGYHTGIYIGNGKFIHAPRRNTRVRIESMDTDYFARNYIGGRRVAGGSRSLELAQATEKADREYQASRKSKSRRSDVDRDRKSKKKDDVSSSRSKKKKSEAREERSSKKRDVSSSRDKDRSKDSARKSRDKSQDRQDKAKSSSRKSDVKGQGGGKSSASKGGSGKDSGSAQKSKGSSSDKKVQKQSKQLERKIEVRRAKGSDKDKGKDKGKK